MNIYTIAALTLERYICLKTNRQITNHTSYEMLILIVYIVVVWTFAFGFTLSKTLSIGKHGQFNDCQSTWSPQTNRIYFIVMLILFCMVPYAIILSLSALLLVFLKKWHVNAKKLVANANVNQGLVQRTANIKKRTTGFVLAIVISFMYTWSPLWLFRIFDELYLLNQSTRYV